MKTIRLVAAAVLVLAAGCSTTANSGRGQFLGGWEQDGPGKERLAIRFAGNGQCIVTEDDRSWNGTWRCEGQKVIVTTGDETVTLWSTGRDTLTAGDGSDGPTAFRRAK